MKLLYSPVVIARHRKRAVPVNVFQCLKYECSVHILICRFIERQTVQILALPLNFANERLGLPCFDTGVEGPGWKKAN